MSDEYNFQKELESSIENADIKLDRSELLEDIFKIYVAKLFELCLNKSKAQNRLPFDALVEVKKNIISEFRKASLGMIQKSVEQYEELFEKTVQEIVNDAGLAHQGEDIMSSGGEFDINKRIYQATHTVTPAGLIVPK
jgi:hypothetical protein